MQGEVRATCALAAAAVESARALAAEAVDGARLGQQAETGENSTAVHAVPRLLHESSGEEEDGREGRGSALFSIVFFFR